MKTAYYTFTTWDDGAMAAGFGGETGENRQSAMVRQPGEPEPVQSGDKVIDLNVWRAANQEELQEELEWEYSESEWEEPPAPRPRRSRRSMLTAELISTLSVVAVAAVLILRILTF